MKREMSKWLKKLVIKEAKNIKKFATKEEIDKLLADSVAPTSTNMCIYGQMTGNCYSQRALELLDLCAKHSDDDNFSDAILREFSPIECAIMGHSDCINPLVDFIKGKTKKFNY
jgi:predicted NAD-dependent protein-ADP-ribosyltransferase YbiA (DUF1768 family)